MMKICSSCALEGNGKFCTRCGSPLIDMESQDHLSSQQPYVNMPAAPANAASDQFTGPYSMPAGNSGPAFSYPNGIPSEYQPISMWGYFGYNIVFCIPLIGWIIALMMALGATSNINVRNYARSFFCTVIIAAVVFVVFFGSIMAAIY